MCWFSYCQLHHVMWPWMHGQPRLKNKTRRMWWFSCMFWSVFCHAWIVAPVSCSASSPEPNWGRTLHSLIIWGESTHSRGSDKLYEEKQIKRSLYVYSCETDNQNARHEVHFNALLTLFFPIISIRYKNKCRKRQNHSVLRWDSYVERIK